MSTKITATTRKGVTNLRFHQKHATGSTVVEVSFREGEHITEIAAKLQDFASYLVSRSTDIHPTYR